MINLRSHIIALLGAIPIILGLLVPAMAAPCAQSSCADTTGLACQHCPDMTLACATICVMSAPAAPAFNPTSGNPALAETPVSFHDFAQPFADTDLPPDSPPPR